MNKIVKFFRKMFLFQKYNNDSIKLRLKSKTKNLRFLKIHKNKIITIVINNSIKELLI